MLDHSKAATDSRRITAMGPFMNIPLSRAVQAIVVSFLMAGLSCVGPCAAYADHVRKGETPRPTENPADSSEDQSYDPVTSGEKGRWRQIGLASWYGDGKWNGQMTSSGVRFDANALSAAHATLPIGTRVKVTLTGSDRSVIVVINDRPGTRKRIIDLSRAAARELGILDRGIAMVTLSRL